MTIYAPGFRQPAHCHLLPQISIQLAGQVRESASSQDWENLCPAISIKPEGFRHSDEYGPEGAIFLSFAFDDENLWRWLVANTAWQWQTLGTATLQSLVATLGSSVGDKKHANALFHLLTLLRPVQPRCVVPPYWLVQAGLHLGDDPHAPIARAAHEARVHRVHLSRSFVRYFGITPSAFRRHRMTSRALRMTLWSDASAAEAAYATGFCDQSHMAREIKRTTGLSLNRLRQLLAIQSARAL